jgi:hypothetical protein
MAAAACAGPAATLVLGQVLEELGLAWRTPLLIRHRRNALLQQVRWVQRDTGQVLGDDLHGLDCPSPGAVVDGCERDSWKAPSEKLGLLPANIGELPVLGFSLGRFGFSVAGQVEQPIRHAHPLNVNVRPTRLLRLQPQTGSPVIGDG